MFNFPDHETLQIDVSDIWISEQKRFTEGKTTLTQCESVYNYLKGFYLLKRHQPFISHEMVGEDPSLKKYYGNYQKRLRLDALKSIDYFENAGAFYDMNDVCVIERSDVNPEDYQKLFALHLHQFEENPEAACQFLSFHYYTSFAGNLVECDRFLSGLEKQQNSLSQSLQTGIKWWRASAPLLVNENWLQTQNERPDCSSFRSIANSGACLVTGNETDLADEELADEEEPLPVALAQRNQPEVIEGEFSQEEILHHFSFLHAGRGEAEGTYLTKEQVETIFQNGIIIPAEPLAQKFKLNLTPRYSKQLVEYFIYHFIRHYNVKAKRKVLIFFGSYLEDFSAALSQRSLENLNKNITGGPPKKCFFKLKDYLPERFQ